MRTPTMSGFNRAEFFAAIFSKIVVDKPTSPLLGAALGAILALPALGGQTCPVPLIPRSQTGCRDLYGSFTAALVHAKTKERKVIHGRR